MVYDSVYYEEHKEKMLSQMKDWRERNPNYFVDYYNNITKPKLIEKKNQQKDKKIKFDKETIEKISPIKIGQSPYGLNGKKRRLLLTLYNTELKAQKFREQLKTAEKN